MPHRFLLLPALALVIAMLAAACGGDGDDETEPFRGESAATDEPARRPVPPDDIPPAQQGEGDEAEADAEPAVAERPAASTETLRPPDPAATPESATDYTVQAGDTLLDIAIRFGATVDELVALNGLANPDSLFVGQVIALPSPDGAEAEADAEAEEPAAPADDAAGGGDSEAVADPADVPDAPPEVTETGEGTSPDTIPQPGPDVTVAELPERPDDFATYSTAVLPWLQTRTEIADILPLFEQWSMPPVADGDRFHLVDTDSNGLSSLIIVYTDPGTPEDFPTVTSNLIIYDPLPDQPDRYRIAYDHQLHTGIDGSDIAVMMVVDITGDRRRDVTFREQFCGAHTCTTTVHVLVRDGEGYRDAVVAPINIPTAGPFDLSDQTGDGLPDIGVEGGTFGSVGAGPPRPFRYLFSGAGGAVQQVAATGLPTDWLVWVIVDGNRAFDAGDYATALGHYDRATSDNALQEWVSGESADLVPLAHLRRTLALALTAQPVTAVAAAQAAAAGSGLVADLSQAFLGAFALETDLTAGCSALNDALALRVDEWDALWDQFGYAVPQFRAEAICPL